MVVMLVVLTFVVLIGLDYFVISKRHTERAARRARAALRPLGIVWRPPQAGVFVQPTWTWGRRDASGDLYLGVHPLLLELVGPPCELETRRRGDIVAEGEPLVSLTREGRRMTVRSPIAARVERVNRRTRREARWREPSADARDWLYRLRPMRPDLPHDGWMTGEAAARWARHRFDDLRDYLQTTMADSHLGVTMADGGAIPTGVLGELDQKVWSGIERQFLSVVPRGIPEDAP
jgi:glycine cleavage system H lipoate-binding protein